MNSNKIIIIIEYKITKFQLMLKQKKNNNKKKQKKKKKKKN